MSIPLNNNNKIPDSLTIYINGIKLYEGEYYGKAILIL